MANTPIEAIPQNTENEEFHLTSLVSPSHALELKMSGLPELITLDFTENSDNVWADIRKGFSIPDLESQEVQARELALQKNKRMVNAMLKRSEPYIYFIAQECAKRGMPSELALLPFIENSTVEKVLFVSSTSVYGEDNEFVTEATGKFESSSSNSNVRDAQVVDKPSHGGVVNIVTTSRAIKRAREASP